MEQEDHKNDDISTGLLSEIKKENPFISFFIVVLSFIALAFSLLIVYFSIQKWAYVPEVPKGLHWSLPYNFTYPLKEPLSKNVLNNVVSFSNTGDIEIGGGISIEKNIYTENYAAHNLRIAVHEQNTIVVASDDSIRVYTVNENDTIIIKHVTPLEGFTNITDIVELNNNILVLMNSNTLLPFSIKEDDSITFGEKTSFEADSTSNSYFDTIDDSCLAIAYTNEGDVYTAIACLDQNKLKMNIMNSLFVDSQFARFAIAGMNATNYIIAYADSKDPEVEDGLTVVAIKRNQTTNELATTRYNTYKYHLPLGPFDFDNINSEIAILTFVDQMTDNGLVALMVRLDPYLGTAEYGTFFNLQEGGASGREPDQSFQFIDIRVLSDTRFGIFYSNFMDGGAMCFIMAEVTSALDIIQLGPEYVLSEPVPDTKHEFYYAAEAYGTDSRFYLVDSLMSNSEPILHIHIGEVRNNPIGICIDQTENSVTIAIAGIVNTDSLSEPLEVGRLYYTDYLGKLVKGPYFGTDVIEGITTYIKTDTEILSMDNVIGYAVSSNQLYIEPKESLN